MQEAKDFVEGFKKSLFQPGGFSFEAMALTLFQFQAKQNPVYSRYLHYLGVQPEKIHKTEEIPFLPIELFKQHRIVSAEPPIEKIFESSGTTSQQTSRHYVADAEWYRRLSSRIFQEFFGDFSHYHFLALLPSYLERENSSLVFMVDEFIRQSQSPYSGFYLNDLEKLTETLQWLLQKKGSDPRKIMLWGVSFALLDLAEHFPMDLSAVMLLETGGMKGRRKELTREEMHALLKEKLNVKGVYSEYGMTELLSQAYAFPGRGFIQPPTMRVYLREINDPFCINNSLRSGVIQVIDLGNVDSCAFIATQDLGAFTAENEFLVLGRLDQSDLRGCNLLYA